MNGTVTAVVITGVSWKRGVMNATVTAVVITKVSWKSGIMNGTVTAVLSSDYRGQLEEWDHEWDCHCSTE